MSWKNYIKNRRNIQMKKMLFLGSLEMIVSLPVMVAPVQAQEVGAEVSQDFTDISKGTQRIRFLKMVEQRLKDNMSGVSINEYVTDVNETIKTGNVIHR